MYEFAATWRCFCGNVQCEIKARTSSVKSWDYFPLLNVQKIATLTHPEYEKAYSPHLHISYHCSSILKIELPYSMSVSSVLMSSPISLLYRYLYFLYFKTFYIIFLIAGTCSDLQGTTKVARGVPFLLIGVFDCDCIENSFETLQRKVLILYWFDLLIMKTIYQYTDWQKTA